MGVYADENLLGAFGVSFCDIVVIRVYRKRDLFEDARKSLGVVERVGVRKEKVWALICCGKYYVIRDLVKFELEL